MVLQSAIILKTDKHDQGLLSTGDFSEGQDPAPRMNGGGCSTGQQMLCMGCLAGYQGIWGSCTSYFVSGTLVVMGILRRRPDRKGPGRDVCLGSEDTPGSLGAQEPCPGQVTGSQIGVLTDLLIPTVL